MKIFICGDSTAASYAPEEAPRAGWGQVLGELLPGAEIVNRATAARSSKSFLYEGRLQKIETEIQPGDALLIQFAHNDESDLDWRRTEPWRSYVNNLSIFIDTARQNGATPVLLTPICIRSWKDGALQPSHDGYLEAVRTLATRRGVALIDVYASGFEAIAQMGDAVSKKLYMHLKKGEYPHYPDGQIDDTHTRREGALLNAGFVAEGLRRIFPALNSGAARC